MELKHFSKTVVGLVRKANEDYIVDKAFEFKIGARGLRTLCEAILNDAMFNLPNSEVKELKITKAYADQKIQNVDVSHLKAVS